MYEWSTYLSNVVHMRWPRLVKILGKAFVRESAMVASLSITQMFLIRPSTLLHVLLEACFFIHIVVCLLHLDISLYLQLEHASNMFRKVLSLSFKIVSLSLRFNPFCPRGSIGGGCIGFLFPLDAWWQCEIAIDFQLQHLLAQSCNWLARFTRILGGPVTYDPTGVRPIVSQKPEGLVASTHGSTSHFPLRRHHVHVSWQIRGSICFHVWHVQWSTLARTTFHPSDGEETPCMVVAFSCWFGFVSCSFTWRDASAMDEDGRIDVRTCCGLVGLEQTRILRRNDPWSWTRDAADRI